jgi:hypothetical protein
MGAVKEKIYALAELVYQIMDAGATDQEIDEYVESQVSSDEYEFYHANKDIIFDTIPYLDANTEQPEDEENECAPHYSRHGFVDNDPHDTEEFDEDKMREDLFDPQDDPTDRNIVTGEMDESYMMKSLNERDDEDDGDELSDYEWKVGKYISDHLSNDDLGDELGDALYDFMGQIRKCMKKRISPKECGKMLMANKKFMKRMKIDEGCNCGGRRPRPVWPTVRRPITPVKRPPIWARPKHFHESLDEIEMPALNEVDYEWMLRNNRERDNAPRFAYGQRTYVDPKKFGKQIAPEYDYNERKSALGHIGRKQEILKDMGYDLDDEIEMPEIAPTKKEIKTLSPRNKQFPDNKFNKLKSEYDKEEILMDRLFKQHKSPKFESVGALDEIARRGFGDDYGDHVIVKKACADQELERYGDDEPDEDDKKDSYKNRFNKIVDITK